MSNSTSASPADQRPRTRKSIAHVPSGAMDSMLEDKENMTADIASSAFMAATKDTISSSKRTRSKSLGPGGLDALNQGVASGNTRKVPPMPRSILKPAIPLSPLREIPSRKQGSPGEKTKTPTGSPQRQTTPRSGQNGSPVRQTPTRNPASPKVDPASTARRTEREKIQKQREARRKSMANRRVSFAPEATLHTWTEPPQFLEPIASGRSTEAPLTPTQNENETASQKRRKRRSSGLQPVVSRDADEVLSSSPYSGSEAGSADDTITTPQKDNESGDTESESDTEEEVEDGDDDSNATGSPMSEATTQDDDEDNSLDAKLHAAAQNANTTSRMAFEEHGEASMEIVGDEVTNAFKPWAQRWEEAMNADAVPQEQATSIGGNVLEFANNVGSASPQGIDADDGEDMSMDMTKAVGRILQSQGRDYSAMNANRRASTRRQSMMQRRISSDTSDLGANTMELTTAVGGIRPRASVVSGQDENEEMSMEFTTAFGKIRGNQSNSFSSQKRQETSNSLDADGDMEMTDDVGGIIDASSYGEANDTAPMEFTTALGGIVQNQPQKVTELTATMKPSITASATGSPAPSASRSRTQSRLSEQQSNLTPSKSPGTPSKQLTPQPQKPSSPNRITPNRNITLRSPSPKMLFQKEIQAKSRSPVSVIDPQLFETNALNGQITPRIVLEPKASIKRRNSGVGMDKEGLGSPRVAAILDRRTSIGENANTFAPSQAGKQGVRFEDPRKLEAEVTRERQEDERRESGRFTLEHEDEPTEGDLTGNIKDMINSMSPKKNRLQGRKSLAVGSAKGLLGKRPAELDNEDDNNDEDEDSTPKGLKGRQSSPVKKIRLQGPPSMADTTGRKPRHTLAVLSGNDKVLTPSSRINDQKPASTPAHHGKFMDISGAEKGMPSFAPNGAPLDPSKLTAGEGQENVSLQAFLDMTNIRFMELNTTRRRHTAAPGSARRGSYDRDESQEEESDPAKRLEDAVAAGASTIPMLELFQHSCRELKKYISEGRHMVKDIETDVYQENPALFREYISAAPKEKHVMDNQFKNMKTHARILSKGMWYEWRMKLLDSLKEGLLSTSRGFKADEDSMVAQEKALEILPSMIDLRDRLNKEATELQFKAEEIANCDQNELGSARQHLLNLEKQIAEKKTLLASRQGQVKEMDEAVDMAAEAKSECQQAIREAQRVREECRGWSVADVAQVKASVDDLEARHDWQINSISGTTITMTHASALELTFNMAAYLPLSQTAHVDSSSASLSLSYVGDQPSQKARRTQVLTTTKRFFLQLLRAHLHALTPHSTQASQILQFVSNSWTIAQAIESSIRNLELVARVSVVEIRGDDRLGVKAELLLRELRTKLEMDFAIGVSVRDDSVSVRVAPSVQVVYGAAGRGREVKMASWLKERVAEGAAWGMLADEIKGRLEGRGKTLVR